ncbi:MAG: hypothetical protein U0516_03055 [Candidatus Saccharibacteria bacterium]
MSEKDPGGTTEFETPADLKKKLAKLEADRAKDQQKIASLERKNGVLTKSLVEVRDRLDSITKKPKAPTPGEVDRNNDQVRPHYSSGASRYAEGMAKFREEQAGRADTRLDPYAELGKKMREAGMNNDNGPADEDEFYNRPGAPSQTERTWEQFGARMRQAGMTQDTAPAHEEEFYNGNQVGDVEPPAPREPNRGELEAQAILGAQEALREQAARLEGIVTDFARRRVESERMFSGKTATNEMEHSAQELNEAFGEWSAALARLITEQNRAVYEQTQAIRADLDDAHQNLRDLEALPDDARPADFDDQVRMVGDLIRRLENQNSQNEQLEAQIRAGLNAMVNEKLMEVRARVDFEMIAERERRHPRLARVGEWLRNHKKTRIAAGVALTGLGFVGAATGNVPLVSAAVAGRAALRGFGGYTATKAGGEWLADRQFNKADIDSIEDYTTAAQRQTRRKRRWSRGAAVAGAGLAAAPIIGNALHATPEAPPTAPKPPDWLNSREFAEMVHHPNTFQKFMSWTESMKAQGWTDAKIAEALSKLPPAPEGFGS